MSATATESPLDNHANALEEHCRKRCWKTLSAKGMMTEKIGTDVKKAAALLRSGRLVAFPTETVYGLGGNALEETAVAKIFAAKNRPEFDPLIVHLHDRAQLAQLVTDVPDLARKLIDHFWPGPLTLVLPKKEIVPDLVTAGLKTVAVRMPAHPVALDLLCRAAVPVAAPSANPFGCISPTTAAHVAEQLGEKVAYILDGGPCRVGVESTVLQVPLPENGSSPGKAETTPQLPVVLRPGGVTVEEIESLIGPVQRGWNQTTPQQQPEGFRSPGMLSRHYAPRTPLTLQHRITAPQAGRRLGLLTFRPLPLGERFAVVEVLSQRGDLTEAAANFFAALRRLDAQRLEEIVAVPFPEEGLGRALNDRLRRAAAR